MSISESDPCVFFAAERTLLTLTCQAFIPEQLRSWYRFSLRRLACSWRVTCRQVAADAHRSRPDRRPGRITVDGTAARCAAHAGLSAGCNQRRQRRRGAAQTATHKCCPRELTRYGVSPSTSDCWSARPRALNPAAAGLAVMERRASDFWGCTSRCVRAGCARRARHGAARRHRPRYDTRAPGGVLHEPHAMGRRLVLAGRTPRVGWRAGVEALVPGTRFTLRCPPPSHNPNAKLTRR